MEALDKTSGTSDSGGIIDLSTVGSACSSNSTASLDKASHEGSDMLFDKKASRHTPGSEGWQANIDDQLQGLKLIEDEEFDFDIPEEYLNISLEVEESPGSQSLLDCDGVHSAISTKSVTVTRPGIILHPLQTGEGEKPCQEPVDCVLLLAGLGDSQEQGIVLEQQQTAASAEDKQQLESPERVQGGTAVGDSNPSPDLPSSDAALEPSDEGGDVTGPIMEGAPPSSPSCERKITVEVEEEEERVVKHLGKHSHLPTPREPLKKTVLCNSPVKCNELEDPRALSKEVTVFLSHSTSDSNNNTSTTSSACGIDRHHDSVPSGVSDASSSVSRESVVCGAEAPPTLSAQNVRGVKIPRAMPRNKPTAMQSLLPSKSTSVIPRVKKQTATKPTKLKGKIPVCKPRVRPSGALAAPTVRLGTNRSRPTVKGSANAVRPVRDNKLAKSSATSNRLSQAVVQKTSADSKPTSMAQGKKGVSRMKPISCAPQQSNRVTTTTTSSLAQPKASIPQTQPSALSTSITTSPSVKQSTPVEELTSTPVRTSIAQASLVTSPLVVPTSKEPPHFSLSSIEASSSPPTRANRTYTKISSPAEDDKDVIDCPVILSNKTPKPVKKKRRSFIPTPSGKKLSHSRFASPILCTEPKAGDTSPSSAIAAPPKTRKTFQPKVKPSGLQRPALQRMRGRGRGVLTARPGGENLEGPMKAKQPFSSYDFMAEVPLPHAKVMHSPVDKENLPATPHSKWSPIRRKKPVLPEDACFQCTKRVPV